MKKILFLAILLVALGITGAAQAATTTDSTTPVVEAVEVVEVAEVGLLPTSPFYIFKSFGEGLVSLFIFGDESNARRAVELSNKRLAEAEALTEAGETEKVAKTIERYHKQVEKALDRAEKAKEGGKDVNDIATEVAGSTLKHQEVLSRVYEEAPEEALEGLMRAMEASSKEYERAFRAISQEGRDELGDDLDERRLEREDRFEELRFKGVPLPEFKSREEIELEEEFELEDMLRELEDELNGLERGEGAEGDREREGVREMERSETFEVHEAQEGFEREDDDNERDDDHDDYDERDRY